MRKQSGRKKNILGAFTSDPFISVALDTTAPEVAVQSQVDDGIVTFSFSCLDSDYSELKIWGDLDATGLNHDLFGRSEAEAPWISKRSSVQFTLGRQSIQSGYQVYFKFRDDVYNEKRVRYIVPHQAASPCINITLDRLVPDVTVQSQTDDNVVTFNFAYTATDYTEIKIWGDLDPTGLNPDLFGPTEADAPWISKRDSIQFTLGRQVVQHGYRVYFKVRDDVWNEKTIRYIVPHEYPAPCVTITLDRVGPEVTLDSWSDIDDHVYFNFTWDVNDYVDFKTWGEYNPYGVNHDLCGQTEFDAPWVDKCTDIEFSLGDSAIGAGHIVYFKFRDDVWNETYVPYLVSRNQTYLLDHYEFGSFFEFQSAFVAADDFSVEHSYLYSESYTFDSGFVIEYVPDSQKPNYFYYSDLGNAKEFALDSIPIAERHSFEKDTAVIAFPNELNVSVGHIYWISGEFFMFEDVSSTDLLDTDIAVDYEATEEAQSMIEAGLVDSGNGRDFFVQFEFNTEDYVNEKELAEMFVQVPIDLGVSVEEAEHSLYEKDIADVNYTLKFLEKILGREELQASSTLNVILPPENNILGVDFGLVGVAALDVGEVKYPEVIPTDFVFYETGTSIDTAESSLYYEDTGVERSYAELLVAEKEIGFVWSHGYADADLYFEDFGTPKMASGLVIPAESSARLYSNVLLLTAPKDGGVLEDTFVTFEFDSFETISSKDSIGLDLLTNGSGTAHSSTSLSPFVEKDSGGVSYNYNFEFYLKFFAHSTEDAEFDSIFSDYGQEFDGAVLSLASVDFGKLSYRQIYEYLFHEFADSKMSSVLNQVYSEMLYWHDDVILSMPVEWSKEAYMHGYADVDYILKDFTESKDVQNLVLPVDYTGFIDSHVAQDLFDKDPVNTSDQLTHFHKILRDGYTGFDAPIDVSIPIVDTDAVFVEGISVDLFSDVTGVTEDKEHLLEYIPLKEDVTADVEATIFIPVFDYSGAVDLAEIILYSADHFDVEEKYEIEDIRPAPIVPINVFDYGYGEDHCASIRLHTWDYETQGDDFAVISFELKEEVPVDIKLHILGLFNVFEELTGKIDLAMNVPTEDISSGKDAGMLEALLEDEVIYTEKQNILSMFTEYVNIFGTDEERITVVAEDRAQMDFSFIMALAENDSASYFEKQTLLCKILKRVDYLGIDTSLLTVDGVEDVTHTETLTFSLFGEDSGVAFEKQRLLELLLQKAHYTECANVFTDRPVRDWGSADGFAVIAVDELKDSAVSHEVFNKEFDSFDVGFHCYNTIVYDPTIDELRDVVYWWHPDYPLTPVGTPVLNPLWGKPIEPMDDDYPFSPDDLLYGMVIPFIYFDPKAPATYSYDFIEHFSHGGCVIYHHSFDFTLYGDYINIVGEAFKFNDEDLYIDSCNVLNDFVATYKVELYRRPISSAGSYTLVTTSTIDNFLDVVLTDHSQSVVSGNTYDAYVYSIYRKGSTSKDVILDLRDVFPSVPIDTLNYTYQVRLAIYFSFHSSYESGPAIPVTLDFRMHCDSWTALANEEYLKYRQKYIYEDGWFVPIDPVVPENIQYKLYIDMGCGLDENFNRKPLNDMERFVYEKKKRYHHLDIVANYTGAEYAVDDTVEIGFYEEDYFDVKECFNKEFNAFDAGDFCINTLVYDRTLADLRDLRYWWEMPYTSTGFQTSTGENYLWGKDIKPGDFDYPFDPDSPDYGKVISYFSDDATWSFSEHENLIFEDSPHGPTAGCLPYPGGAWTKRTSLDGHVYWYKSGVYTKNYEYDLCDISGADLQEIKAGKAFNVTFSFSTFRIVTSTVKLGNFTFELTPGVYELTPSATLIKYSIPFNISSTTHTEDGITTITYTLTLRETLFDVRDLFSKWGSTIDTWTFHLRLNYTLFAGNNWGPADEYGGTMFQLNYNTHVGSFYYGFGPEMEYFNYRKSVSYNDGWFIPIDAVVPENIPYKLYLDMGCGPNSFLPPWYDDPDEPEDRMERFIYEKMKRHSHLDIVANYAGEENLVEDNAIIGISVKYTYVATFDVDISTGDTRYITRYEFGFECDNVSIYSPTILLERDLIFWWENGYNAVGRGGVPYTTASNTSYGQPITKDDLDYPYYAGDKEYGMVINPFYSIGVNNNQAFIIDEVWMASRTGSAQPFPGVTPSWHRDSATGNYYFEDTVPYDQQVVLYEGPAYLFKFKSDQLTLTEMIDAPWLVTFSDLVISFDPYEPGQDHTATISMDVAATHYEDDDTKRTFYYAFDPDVIEANCISLFETENLTEKTIKVYFTIQFRWTGRFWENTEYNFAEEIYYYGTRFDVTPAYEAIRAPYVAVETDGWFKARDISYYEPNNYKVYINMGCGVNEIIERPPVDRFDKFMQEKMKHHTYLNIEGMFIGDHGVEDGNYINTLYSDERATAFDYRSGWTVFVRDYADSCVDTLIFSETDFAQRDLIPWWYKNYPQKDNLHLNPKWLQPIEPGDIDYPYEIGDPLYGTIIEPLLEGEDFSMHVEKFAQDGLQESYWRATNDIYTGTGTPTHYDSGIHITHNESFDASFSVELVGVGVRVKSCDIVLNQFTSVKVPYSISTGTSSNGTSESMTVQTSATQDLIIRTDAHETSGTVHRTHYSTSNKFGEDAVTVDFDGFLFNNWDALDDDYDYTFTVDLRAATTAHHNYEKRTYSKIGISGWESYRYYSNDYYDTIDIVGDLQCVTLVKNAQYFELRKKYITDPIDFGLITTDFYDDLFQFKYYVNLGCGPSGTAFPIAGDDIFHKWVYRTAKTGNYNHEFIFAGDLGVDEDVPVIELAEKLNITVHFHPYFPGEDIHEIFVEEFVIHREDFFTGVMGEDISIANELYPAITLYFDEKLKGHDLAYMDAFFTVKDVGTVKIDPPLIYNLSADVANSFDGTVIDFYKEDAGDVDFNVSFLALIKVHDNAFTKVRDNFAIPVASFFEVENNAVVSITRKVDYKDEEHATIIQFVFGNDHGTMAFFPLFGNPIRHNFISIGDAVIHDAINFVGEVKEYVVPDRNEVYRDFGYVCFWVQIVNYPFVIDWLAGHFVDYYNELVEAEYLRVTSCFGMPPGGWPKVKQFPGKEIIPHDPDDPVPPYIPDPPYVPPYPWTRRLPMWPRRPGSGRYDGGGGTGGGGGGTGGGSGGGGGYIHIPVDGHIEYIPDPSDPPEPYDWAGGTAIFMTKFNLDKFGENGVFVVDAFYFAVFDAFGERVSDVLYMALDTHKDEHGNVLKGNTYGALCFYGFDFQPHTKYYIRETDKNGNVLTATYMSKFSKNKYSIPQFELECETGDEGKCVNAGTFYNIVEEFGEGEGVPLPGGPNNYKPKLYPNGDDPRIPPKTGPGGDSPFVPKTEPGIPEKTDPIPIPPYIDGLDYPPIVPPDLPYPPLEPLVDPEDDDPDDKDENEIDVPGYEGKLLHRYDYGYIKKDLINFIPVDMLASIWEYHYVPADFILERIEMFIEPMDGFGITFEEPFKMDGEGFKFEYEEPFQFETSGFQFNVIEDFYFDDYNFFVEYTEDFYFDEVVFEFEMQFEDFVYELVEVEGEQQDPDPVVVGEVRKFTGGKQPLCTRSGHSGVIYYQVDGGDWSYIPPERTDVGVYEVNWFAAASELYYGYGTKLNYYTVTSVIERGDPSFTLGKISIGYQEPTLVPFTYFGDGELSVEVEFPEICSCEIIDIEEVSEIERKVTLRVTGFVLGSGSKITIKATEGKNYLAGEVTVLCSIAMGFMSSSANDVEIVYTGEPSFGDITVIGPDEYKIFYSPTPLVGGQETDKRSSVDFYLTVGAYMVYYMVEAKGYLTVYGSYYLKITKAIQPIVVTPTSTVYDETDHSLIESVEGNVGPIWYSMDGVYYSVQSPDAKLPGSYTVYWYCLGDSNYYDSGAASLPNSVTAFIDKKTLDGKIDNQSVDLVDGTLTVVVPTESDGKITVSLSDYSLAEVTVSGTTLNITAYREGGLFVFAQQKEGTYYKAHTFSFYLTIVDSRITYMVNPVSAVYTGDVINLSSITIVHPMADICVVRFAKEPITPSTQLYEEPAFYTNAGEYQIYFVIGASGYQTTYGQYTLTIDRAANPFSIVPLDIEYDGRSHYVCDFELEPYGDLWFSVDNTDTWERTLPTRMGVGEYTVYWYCIGDRNHADIGNYASPESFVAIIREPSGDYINYEVTGDASVDYNGEIRRHEIPLTILNPATDLCTVKYAKEPITDDTELYDTPYFYLAGGEYTIYFVITADGYLTTYGEYKLTINPVVPRVVAYPESMARYQGRPIDFIYAVPNNYACYFSLDKVTWTSTFYPRAELPGDYTVYWYCVGSNNFIATGSREEPNTFVATIYKAVSIAKSPQRFPVVGPIGTTFSIKVENRFSGGLQSDGIFDWFKFTDGTSEDDGIIKDCELLPDGTFNFKLSSYVGRSWVYIHQQGTALFEETTYTIWIDVDRN